MYIYKRTFVYCEQERGHYLEISIEYLQFFLEVLHALQHSPINLLCIRVCLKLSYIRHIIRDDFHT